MSIQNLNRIRNSMGYEPNDSLRTTPEAEYSKPAQWYSKHAAALMLTALVLIVIPLSSLIPPFQSPDEFNHVKRAYLLSAGHVLFETKDNQTGGNIDTGLLRYMEAFERIPFKYHEKISRSTIRDSKRIRWTGENRFSALPNTAVYFPLAYTPQAIAFFTGKHIGLSVSDTYYFARALSLLASIAMLWGALRLYPTPPIVLALFCTPMALFQLSSASLDGGSFAMCVLTSALFMRAADTRFKFSRTMHFALTASLLLISTSRSNLVGLAWLPAVLYPIRHSRSFLVSAAVSVGLSTTWIVFATLSVKGAQIQEWSSLEILGYYVRHLDSLWSVMISTFTNGTLLLGYWTMFVGVLGWLDTPLDSIVYPVFAVLGISLAVITLQTERVAWEKSGRAALALGAIFSTMLLFLIFLTTYTVHPARVVESIQGRYFYPLFIFLGFALFNQPTSRLRISATRAILMTMLMVSLVSITPKLLARYWVS